MSKMSDSVISFVFLRISFVFPAAQEEELPIELEVRNLMGKCTQLIKIPNLGNSELPYYPPRRSARPKHIYRVGRGWTSEALEKFRHWVKGVEGEILHGEESVAACAQSKDDMTCIKEQRSINRWPCLHQVYFVVQLGLGENSCINK